MQRIQCVRLSIALALVVMCFMALSASAAEVPETYQYNTLADYEQATGTKLEGFNEAPSLAGLVSEGKLPPVENRIPKDALVVIPQDEIGQYGGQLRSGTLGIHTGGPDPRSTVAQAWLAVYPPASGNIVPNIAKGWDISEDLKTITIYMREGMKWSDGAPFTTEDVQFWYEDMLLNPEVTPAIPSHFSPDGEVMKLEVVDTYTFRVTFSVPYPAFLGFLAAEYGNVGIHAPKHYLKQFHIKYNSNAGELAKGMGFETWWQSFNDRAGVIEAVRDPNRPSVDPWVLKEVAERGDKVFVRNPYYWKVDTEGNQLPYVDELRRIFTPNMEIQDLKLLSGELNYGGCKLSLEHYPLYKANEKDGGFRTVLLSSDVRTNQGMTFNLWHKDPVLREIFRDVRFRQALSLGMNRQKINDMLFMGLATPWQATTSPALSFYEEGLGEYCTKYDPERANQLLDEMGLKWDAQHKYRLRPDGQPLVLNIQYVDLGMSWGERLELKATDWEKLGIRVLVNEIERSLYETMLAAAELDFAIWNYEAEELDLRYSKSYLMYGVFWNAPWTRWHWSDGQQGEEPPEDVQAYFKLVDEWAHSLPGTPDYEELGKKVFRMNVESLWSIGDLIGSPQPAVFAEDLRNTPTEGPLIWPGQRFWKQYRPDQWFFVK